MNKHWILASCLGAALISHLACAQTPATTTPPPAPTVAAATKGSLIKIDGRMFVGIFKSGADGAYPYRTLDIPDAKLRFTFTPSKDVTIVNRFSNNKGNNNGFDYFYLDLKNWNKALPDSVLRVGKIKIDVGEETWTDNPVENILISTSAAGVSGYDEGINFRGSIPGVKRPLTYSLAVMNASKGVETSARGLATVAKIGSSPLDNLYLSASYYHTGDMVKPKDGGPVSSDLKVANLTDAPTGATAWQRSLWEVDARWNYGATGTKSVVGNEADVPFQLAAAIGGFSDDATGATDRDGALVRRGSLQRDKTRLPGHALQRSQPERRPDGHTGQQPDRRQQLPPPLPRRRLPSHHQHALESRIHRQQHQRRRIRPPTQPIRHRHRDEILTSSPSPSPSGRGGRGVRDTLATSNSKLETRKVLQ